MGGDGKDGGWHAMKMLDLVACLAFAQPQPGALQRECVVLNEKPVPAPQCLAVVEAFEVARLAGKKPVMFLETDDAGGRKRLGPIESLHCEPEDAL